MITPSGGEPILIGAALTSGGSILVWAVWTLLGMRDSLKAIAIAIYGDPSDKEPNGIKRELRCIRDGVREHIDEQRQFNAGFSAALTQHQQILSIKPRAKRKA